MSNEIPGGVSITPKQISEIMARTLDSERQRWSERHGCRCLQDGHLIIEPPLYVKAVPIVALVALAVFIATQGMQTYWAWLEYRGRQ